MARALVAKIGASVVTAIAGGSAWLVVEPGARSVLPEWTGASVERQDATDLSMTRATMDLSPDPDANPSFDCTDASRTIERLICSDPALAEADRSLGRIWSSLDRRGLVDEALREGQLQWLAARDACLIDPEPGACVRRAMLGRIRELSIL